MTQYYNQNAIKAQSFNFSLFYMYFSIFLKVSLAVFPSAFLVQRYLLKHYKNNPYTRGRII